MKLNIFNKQLEVKLFHFFSWNEFSMTLFSLDCDFSMDDGFGFTSEFILMGVRIWEVSLSTHPEEETTENAFSS